MAFNLLPLCHAESRPVSGPESHLRRLRRPRKDGKSKSSPPGCVERRLKFDVVENLSPGGTISRTVDDPRSTAHRYLSLASNTLCSQFEVASLNFLCLSIFLCLEYCAPTKLNSPVDKCPVTGMCRMRRLIITSGLLICDASTLTLRSEPLSPRAPEPLIFPKLQKLPVVAPVHRVSLNFTAELDLDLRSISWAAAKRSDGRTLEGKRAFSPAADMEAPESRPSGFLFFSQTHDSKANAAQKLEEEILRSRQAGSLVGTGKDYSEQVPPQPLQQDPRNVGQRFRLKVGFYTDVGSRRSFQMQYLQGPGPMLPTNTFEDGRHETFRSASPWLEILTELEGRVAEAGLPGPGLIANDGIAGIHTSCNVLDSSYEHSPLLRLDSERDEPEHEEWIPGCGRCTRAADLSRGEMTLDAYFRMLRVGRPADINLCMMMSLGGYESGQSGKFESLKTTGIEGQEMTSKVARP
ncbi:hypothetical protein SODALDRAFT_360791 [Sodiomyces alkalinus F11]|uniref:Uncharacterized protein n=1 Tax=Sodiomyces alkalinus (strain CBS 110278 / VKM F-3762 / F11) TaxID=1314773 RepID=A0A3N2PRH5_SODAK|nr:hypothetical protein SODALDRAFT_360791 [Sodiomyces alkalinus F11]ROT37113.1 hypothetical protein SODALDRAFT_360791 [Sodiomyces alkalinus F11]